MMPDSKLRWILCAAVFVLALSLASPALAVPKFCGCWCKLEFPGTACTEVTVFGYEVTTCGDWLYRNFGDCAEPGPFFASTELALPDLSSPESSLTETSLPDLASAQQPALPEEEPALSRGPAGESPEPGSRILP